MDDNFCSAMKQQIYHLFAKQPKSEWFLWLNQIQLRKQLLLMQLQVREKYLMLRQKHIHKHILLLHNLMMGLLW